MPNQIKKDKEKINYIIDYPTPNPRRISNELRQVSVNFSGVVGMI
jgi:hypothetical protein